MTTHDPQPANGELPWPVRQIGGTIGAEITGIALGDLTSASMAPLRAALDRHRVLFFPDQHLDDDAHRGFASLWGPLEIHPLIPHVDAVPEIVELSSERGVADTWHTDVTFAEPPPQMSVLRTLVTPASGGDTMWSNQVAAFAALSRPMRDMLRSMTAHHAAVSFGRPDQFAIHPVVRVHPGTGEEVLYVNRLFTQRILQLSAGESRAVLDHLFDHCEQHRFTARYRWSQGSVAIWDNRCTQHFVVDDFEGLRVIRRATVSGDTPTGVAPSSDNHDDARRVGSTSEILQRVGAPT